MVNVSNEQNPKLNWLQLTHENVRKYKTQKHISLSQLLRTSKDSSETRNKNPETKTSHINKNKQ